MLFFKFKPAKDNQVFIHVMQDGEIVVEEKKAGPSSALVSEAAETVQVVPGSETENAFFEFIASRRA